MARAKAEANPDEPKGPAAALPKAGEEGVLYLVDLSGYVFRAYHAVAPLSNSKGEPTHAVMGTVMMLQRIVNERKPSLLAIAMDSKGPTFRHAMDERYKATRPPAPPDLSQQMSRCEEIVSAYNIPVYQREGVEADDLIATVVRRAEADGLRVVIVSADKDLMQLVHDSDDRVLLWDSMRDRVFGPTEVFAKFGVRPGLVRDLLALTGDTSDNVPGVPGVGPKTAADLLTTYGSFEELYKNVDAITKPKLRESLRTNEAEARLSLRLVTLTDDLEIKWDPSHLKYGGADTARLRQLFEELEFHRQLHALQGGEVPRANAIVRVRKCVLDVAELEAICNEALSLGVVALDTETTSLDPMRAEIVGFSLSVRAGVGHYIPIGHRYIGCPPQIPWDVARPILSKLFTDPKVTKVGHNLKYDAIVLLRHGVPITGPTFDTMIASYLLDPGTPNGLKESAERELSVKMVSYDEVTKKQRGSQLRFDEVFVAEAAEYAAADADLTMSLYEKFEPLLENNDLGKLLREVELPLASVLQTMEMTGVLVDVARLAELSVRVERELRALDAKAKELAGRDFSVRSRDQLEKILFDELGLPVIKKTPKGGRSTDAEVLEELAESHPLPKTIIEYRELDKLKGTYIDALPTFVNPQTGRIHTSFHQATAATGRLASNDPNLQNIPIRTELGREIRGAFIAPKGSLIVSADYSQIELRVLAHLSHDEGLVEAFRADVDVHTRTAALMFGIAEESVTPEMRRQAKAINFGVIYGMGEFALGKQLGISRDKAASFIEQYFVTYKGVRVFMDKTIESAREGEAVLTLFGRRRFLPNLKSTNRVLRAEAERIAKNTPIQGTAADILKIAMVSVGNHPPSPGARMILTVHDELVFEVPEAEVEGAVVLIRKRMEEAVKLDVPLRVDVGVGPSWAEAH